MSHQTLYWFVGVAFFFALMSTLSAATLRGDGATAFGLTGLAWTGMGALAGQVAAAIRAQTAKIESLERRLAERGPEGSSTQS